MSDSDIADISVTKQQTKRVGRSRKYASMEECISVNAKRQCEQKRALTYIRHKLKNENHQSQLFILNLISTKILDDEFMDNIKDLIVSHYSL